MNQPERHILAMLDAFPHLLELFPLDRFLEAALAEAATLAGRWPVACYVPCSRLLATKTAKGMATKALAGEDGDWLDGQLAGKSPGPLADGPLKRKRGGQAPPCLIDIHAREVVPCLILSRPVGYLFLPKGAPATEKLLLLSRLMGYYLQRHEVETRLEQAGRSLVIMGCCPTIFDIQEQLERYAPAREPILITGETGSGKEVFALAAHALSPRRGAPFISVNCAAAPEENLLRDEFFGHRKGAFTGALFDKEGCLQEANGGTLFLDEIAGMSHDLQGLLLRALVTGEVKRIGDPKLSRVDVRLISATNQNLLPLAGRAFRPDLYYRISAFHIHVPPLRERQADLLFLARYILYRFARENGFPEKQLSRAAKRKLLTHSWPGNVRELENVLKRAFVDAEGEMVEARHLRFEEAGGGPASIADDPWAAMRQGRLTFWEAVHRPFMRRDLTRADVMLIVSKGLEQSGGSLKGLASRFQVEEKDYARFVAFLHRHGFRGKNPM